MGGRHRGGTPRTSPTGHDAVRTATTTTGGGRGADGIRVGTHTRPPLVAAVSLQHPVPKGIIERDDDDAIMLVVDRIQTATSWIAAVPLYSATTTTTTTSGILKGYCEGVGVGSKTAAFLIAAVS